MGTSAATAWIIRWSRCQRESLVAQIGTQSNPNEGGYGSPAAAEERIDSSSRDPDPMRTAAVSKKEDKSWA